jgi:hypothetical protein
MISTPQQLRIVTAHCTAAHQQLAVVAVTSSSPATAVQQLAVVTGGAVVGAPCRRHKAAVVRRHAVHFRSAGELAAIGVAAVEERVVGVVSGGEAAAAAFQLELVEMAGGGGEGRSRGLLGVVVARTLRRGNVLRRKEKRNKKSSLQYSIPGAFLQV